MPADGIIIFIVIIGTLAAAVGFLAEFFMCRIENPAAKFVLPVAGTVLWLLCGILTQNFTGDGAALFGIITIGAVIMLAAKLIFGRSK
ncbi:MAG: hypothetical protein IJA92_00865 [Oscillospiraceae bacterium]|nr:hypothetical protein [Oscillospiraceae bacterium]